MKSYKNGILTLKKSIIFADRRWIGLNEKGWCITLNKQEEFTVPDDLQIEPAKTPDQLPRQLARLLYLQGALSAPTEEAYQEQIESQK